MLIMPDHAICKQILVARAAVYSDQINKCSRNECAIPYFRIFNVCAEFGILDMYLAMIECGCHMGKPS